MRLGCLLFVGMLAALGYGGQGIYQGAVNREQKVITYTDFVKQKPSGGWFKIKNCVYALPEAMVKTRKGRITEVFLPVYDAAALNRGDQKAWDVPLPLILATDNHNIINSLEEIKSLETMNEAQADEYVSKNFSRLYVREDLEGMVRFGLESDSSTRSKLAGLSKSLDPNYAILQEGAKPNLLGSIGVFILGIVLAIVQLFMYFGRGSSGE
jgi:hypothetical protein